MTEEQAQNTTGIDEIWESAGKEDVQEGATPEGEAPTDPAPTGDAEAAPEMYEYTALGKTISEDRETVLKRASMGYDYAQKMEALKAREEEVNQRAANSEKWAEYDKYAQENPEWQQHWDSAWNNRSQPVASPETGNNQGGGEFQGEIQSLKAELEEFKTFMTSQVQAEEDKAYMNQLRDIQEKYPDVDLKASNPDTGQTLEHQVLKYCNENGINDFSVGFKAFNHDRGIAAAKEAAKKEVLEELQKNRKAGIMGITNTPTQPANETDLSKLSGDELVQAALAEWEAMD